MTPIDDVSSVHRDFSASPRRLLAAVLAIPPMHFRMVSARGSTLHFTFSIPSADGYRTGEHLLGLITSGPTGSQLLVCHEQSTTSTVPPRVQAAMEDFVDRVQFVFDHPDSSEVAKRAADAGFGNGS